MVKAVVDLVVLVEVFQIQISVVPEVADIQVDLVVVQLVVLVVDHLEALAESHQEQEDSVEDLQVDSAEDLQVDSEVRFSVIYFIFKISVFRLIG